MSHLTADIVVLVHFGFILFVIFGGLFVLKWRWMIWLHIPAAIWGSVVIIFGWICPLTPLENMLRQANGNGAYTGGFIAHYIVPVIYPPGLTREVQVTIGITLVLVNIIIYAFAYRRWRRDKEALR